MLCESLHRVRKWTRTADPETDPNVGGGGNILERGSIIHDLPVLSSLAWVYSEQHHVGSLEELLLFVRLNGAVRGRVSDAGQGEALGHLVLVEERAIRLVD